MLPFIFEIGKGKLSRLVLMSKRKKIPEANKNLSRSLKTEKNKRPQFQYLKVVFELLCSQVGFELKYCLHTYQEVLSTGALFIFQL